MAETAVTTRTRVRRRFDVWNEVPLVPQLTGMSCWAAAAAMIVGWRDRMAADPRQVADGAGSWQAYAGGLRPADVQTLAKAWGLVEERRESWTVDALRQVLERHGPVWLGEASPGLHSIVVVGMHGDGTPDGTWVRVNDPWPVGRGERYTLPWRTLSANYRAAGDLIGMQAHVLHAGGRRGSSRTHVSESRVTRSSLTLPPLPGSEDPMIMNGNGRHPHADDYTSAYGSPLAIAAAVAAGSRYLNTASGGGTDPLQAHGGTGENLYLAWNEIPDDARAVDLVVHLHGYADHAPDTGATRYVVGKSGLQLNGRTRPTLALVPRGRKRTRAEYDALMAEWKPKHEEWKRKMKEFEAAPAGTLKKPDEPAEPRSDVYTFPALQAGKGAGLAALVEWALGWFAANVMPGGLRPAIARCILTAHSGGGAAVNALLQWKDQRDICNPHEVHLFDSTYGIPSAIQAWAAARVAADRRILLAADVLTRMRAEGGACRIFYVAGTGTQKGAREIAKAFPPAGDALQPAWRAEATTFGHNEIPNTFGPTLLQDVRATMNLDRPRPAGRGQAAGPDSYDAYPAGYPAAEPAYGFVEALAVDDDVRAWLAARTPADRAPHAATVRAWIIDTTRSGIELIADPARRRHFLGEVDWTRVDFPGNHPDRSAESKALFNAMAEVVPERRVPMLIRYHDVDRVVQPVPGQTSFRLHPAARDSFVRMRDAARADGVELRIRSAWRSRARQQELAKQNSNPNAVAQGISAHNYGLAVDLSMAVEGLSVGNSTGSMTNMVALYRSPAYKWMALHGREHGWFPYRKEPWHWEYNPQGFAEIFEREAQGSAQGQAYGAPLGLFERYPAGALDAAPVQRIAVPRIADVRPSLSDALQAPAVDWCAMRQTIATTARGEEARWTRPNGSKLVESDASQLPILQQYWQAVPGFSNATRALDAARRSAANQDGWEWSAAFICFVMNTAGVRPAHGFDFAPRHMNYIVSALRNRERSDTARPFWLVDHPELEHEVTLEPGDLLCMNRPVKGVWTTHTYQSLRRAFWENGHEHRDAYGSSHTALIVATGQDARGRFVQTIGGNEDQSVRLRRVDLTANGGIANALARRIFGLIKMTGCNR